MEKDKFYKLVEDMRLIQSVNANRHLSLGELLEQWQIEFLVDDELYRNRMQNYQNPKTPVTFSTFSDQYCPN